MTKRGVLAATAAGLLQGCSPLKTFNVLTPNPLNVRRTRDLAYGRHPRQTVDVYAPKGEGPWPLLVFFYGGGWESGSRQEYAFAGRAFASKGFVTVVADYRPAREAPYPAFLEDCAAAVTWAQERARTYGADPARTVLVGHSAGAYNVAMLALDPRWLAAAKAPLPIKAWAGLSGPYDFLPLSPGPGLRTFGGVRDLEATQPIGYAGAGDPPAFLTWGDRDKVVMPRNSERMAARLKAGGVAVRTRVYPGAGHAELVLALAWPVSLHLPVLRETSAFLHAALEGRATP